jgi:alpha-ketoglutaric semialdehyde dehydrogenase
MQETNFIGFSRMGNPRHFWGKDPATGKETSREFSAATVQQTDEAVKLAKIAFPLFSNLPRHQRASFLRAIGQSIMNLGDELISLTSEETGLPPGRLQGERARTVDQLNQFAGLIEEGSWVEATIDEGMPERKPLPRPALCRMLVPLGPVAVFGASNFPLAFSVAGGDTASALAGGNPVIVKAHPGHPGCSEMVGTAIIRAAQETQMPEGVFSLLFDDGVSIGTELVAHPGIQAVGFTGSFEGGQALCKIAAQRKTPIPVFTEMGSVNPVFLLPGALKLRAGELARQCASSVTLGTGQFCTNPGILIAMQSPELELFIQAYGHAIEDTPPGIMLSHRIADAYRASVTDILNETGVRLISRSLKQDGNGLNQGHPAIARIRAEDFVDRPMLHREVFGPFSLLVCCGDPQIMEKVIENMEGQLTISVMAAPGELDNYPDLLRKIRSKAGRIICNGMPTGVEVCASMQHGGPFPASSDQRFTSVGTYAIKRFVRPVCYQNWDDALLPDELKSSNPLKITRLVNNVLTR